MRLFLAALVGLFAILTLLIGTSAVFTARDVLLPLAVSGERRDIAGPAGRLSYYAAPRPAGSASADLLPPLLLVHSVNAAASAYEMRPIFEAVKARRAVYALDLPGFGFSDRAEIEYSPRIMTDAVLAVVAEIAREHGPGPIDALALSLGTEFLARAAVERPEAFRSITLVSPTGLDRGTPYLGPPGSDRGRPALEKAFTVPLWRRPLFDLLVTRTSIRFFLQKAFGSKTIDEGLLDYCYATAHQPGAEHAPFRFVGGFLFSADISRVHEELRLPVLVIHGTRGDFVDYSGLQAFRDEPNWDVVVLQTGALPQFEVLDEMMRTHEAFIGRLERTGADAAAAPP